MSRRLLALSLSCLAITVPVWAGPSVYLTAPDDPKAITVRATGDGDPATDQFATPAEMFARDIAVPTRRQFVSPDGRVAVPEYRTLSQGPAGAGRPRCRPTG